MDPIIAYFLLRNIEKEKDTNFSKKQIQLSLLSIEESRGYNKILCSFCGQNLYWCQCEKIKQSDDNP